MIGHEYDELHEYIVTQETGFIIKFYGEELCGVVYGIRYGNLIILSNLECRENKDKIIEILKKFINKFVNKMKSLGDKVDIVYLASGDGKLNKAYATCVKNIGVKLDYMESSITLYDSFKKINKYSYVKYKINDMEYKDVSKRANKINILRLIGMNDFEKLIGYEYVEAIKVGRNWYKDNEDTVLD